MTVEQALARLGEVRRRSPCAYTSTWPLEEVELVRPDGTPLTLLVKHSQAAAVSKPAFMCDPSRELGAYRLLEHERLGLPRCYASGPWGLALEKVEGVELGQRGLDAWTAVARWAARLHERFSRRPPLAEHLLRHDEALHRLLLARAHAGIGELSEALARGSEIAIARLSRLPGTLIHGELYPSNVLVADGRIAVVDWEMTAVGPGAIDLAALTTGWRGDDRRAILAAYGEAEEADLAAARLVLALQWLGWAPDWHPPAEHRHDWLAEAHAAAEVLL